MQRPVHLATPMEDGRRTECQSCFSKSAFGKETCQEHRSDWIANTQDPQWNRKLRIHLDAGAGEIVIAVYTSSSRGKPHGLLGWFHVPSHVCLYTKAVKRTYSLMRADGTPLKVKALDPMSHVPMQKQALIHVSWRLHVTKKQVSAGQYTFIEVGTPITRLNGIYNKRWPGGASYYGSWQDGQPHGKGKYTNEDGAHYEGEWLWGKMNGQGTFKFSNGDVYSGAWKNNLRHGQGRCEGHNGDVYQGEWRFGFQHGVGKHETEDGFVYDGEWKQNKAHGVGLVHEPNGLRWDGIFHEVEYLENT